MSDARIGQNLGKYTITEKIGRGGMAEVFKAYQENLDRYVAVKIMHPFLIELEGENFLNRFRREARAMAALNHPHIVKVYDFDTFNKNNHYIVMDYVGGGSLKEQLERLADNGQRMPMQQSIKIITKIADALAYAHRREMIHRDIKPANILMGEDGEPYLTDFGIVKLVGGQTIGYTATGALIGTPAYMSPEQALGEPGDARSDIYSLGVMLFQMVTGTLPFNADTPLAVAMKHVNEQIPLPVTFNPNVPQSLQTVILKALDKEPNRRYQSAGDMAMALRLVDLAGAKATAAPLPPVPPTVILPPSRIHDTTPPPAQGAPGAQPPKKRRWPWAAALIVLLLAAAGGYFVFGPGLGLPGFGGRTQVSVVTATPSITPIPTTAVPTITPTPSNTPNTVATILAAANLTAAAAAPTAVTAATDTPKPTKTAVPDQKPTETPTATPTPTATEISNATGAAHTGGGLPLAFETFGTWVRGDEENGTFTQSAAHVHGGGSAAKLSYNFPGSSNDYVVFLQLNSISGTPNALKVWVYGDGSGHYLNAWIVDNNGETWQVPFGRVTHTGWQQMTGVIQVGQAWPWTHISGPSNSQVDYPITFRGFVLDDINDAYSGQGTIYLDDLTTATTSGVVPTAPPAASTQPAATAPPPTVNPGDVGRILYTSGSTLLTTDPNWAAPQELGTAASDTCGSPATTVAGQSYNLYYGYYCGIGATGTGVCTSPNGQYEVITDHTDGNNYSIVVRQAGAEQGQFVYQGVINRAEGIRWSPLSDSFLFMIDNSVYRAFPGGNYNAVIPTASTPIFSQDGSLILYLKAVGPGVHDVFVSNADGSNQHNVTNVLAVDKTCAAWRN